MKKIYPGEEQRFFPSFFLQALLLALALGSYFFPLTATAQRTEREGLSRFDRLAEEATLLNKHGQFDKVITLLEPHKADRKNDSTLFFNELGLAYRQKGKLSEAIRAYQTGIACNPRMGIIYYNLAVAYHAKGQLPEAAECCDKAAVAGYAGDPAFVRMVRSYRKEKKPEPTTPPTVQ